MNIVHPYADLHDGGWVRGNLHAHTNRSDGARPPQAVIDDYARRGHGFLMISDHDVFTGPEAYAAWDARQMVLIPGNEITARGPHMLHVNARGRVEPHADRQRAIDEAIASGGFVIANHPNWELDFDHCPISSLALWQGYSGIEIYNGVIGRLAGSPYAVDKWDMLLSNGRRLWGFANDDSHLAEGECGLGWNCVNVRHRSVESIVAALAAGRFYASTGVEITGIHVHGSRIRIETANATRIVALQRFARRLAVVDGPDIEIEAPGDAGYVRFECWGAGELFAWTQPFFIEP